MSDWFSCMGRQSLNLFNPSSPGLGSASIDAGATVIGAGSLTMQLLLLVLAFIGAACVGQPAVSMSDIEALPIRPVGEFMRDDRPHLERSEVLMPEDVRARFGDPTRIDTEPGDRFIGDLVWWYPSENRRGDEVPFDFTHLDVPSCSDQVRTGCATQGGFRGWVLVNAWNPAWGP